MDNSTTPLVFFVNGKKVRKQTNYNYKYLNTVLLT